MASTSATNEQLLAANAELRARLAEAEDTLRAIRSGEVDALVVETTDGPQVFTLQGLDAEANRFRGEILAQVSDSVIVVDADQRVTYLNAAAERQYGLVAATTLGCKLTDLYGFRWLCAEDEAESMTALCERGEWRGESIHVTRAGLELRVESCVTVIRAGDGSPSGLIAVIRDITGRQRITEELQRASELLDTLLRTAPIGFCFIDRDLRFVRINARLAEINGLTAEAHLGRHVSEVVPQLVDTLRDVTGRILATGEAVLNHEFSGETPSAPGVMRTWDESWYPVRDSAGVIVGFGAIIEDITERKHAQAQLRQLAVEASDAHRRKDEFLATLAHELRNPLAPIRTGLHLMKLAAPTAAEEVHAMMDRQVTQMVRLIDDLMDVSRITQGKLELRKERVPLVDVLNSALETSVPLIEQLGHELTITLPEQALIVDADTTRLAQVFLNLLNNAAKYSDRGGHIHVTVERQGSDAVVTVKDTGIGIAADELPHIFEMFTQVDHAFDRSYGGLGIGLTLVQRLVEMHGGSVEARSEGRGKGSEFVTRLPVVVEASRPQASGREAEPHLTSPHRILIVDDNCDGADSLSEILRVMGHDTRTAYDGQEGVDVAGAFQPDVLLLDIGLPKLNGYEVCRRIREQSWGKGVVLIALTGWGQDDDRRRSQEAGFDHHLVKPVDPEALMTLLAGLDGDRPGYVA